MMTKITSLADIFERAKHNKDYEKALIYTIEEICGHGFYKTNNYLDIKNLFIRMLKYHSCEILVKKINEIIVILNKDEEFLLKITKKPSPHNNQLEFELFPPKKSNIKWSSPYNSEYFYNPEGYSWKCHCYDDGIYKKYKYW